MLDTGNAKINKTNFPPWKKLQTLEMKGKRKQTRKLNKCKGAIHPIIEIQGFPGGAVVENLPANAGDTGSSPSLGRSYMPQSNWAREPQLLSLRVWSLCSATRGRDSERPVHRDEEWSPLAATRESPRTKQRPNTAINK